MNEKIIEDVKRVWDEQFASHISPWYMRGYKVSDWALLEGLPLHEMTALNIGAAYPIDALNIGWKFKHYTESDFTEEIVEKMKAVYEVAYPPLFQDYLDFAVVDVTDMSQYEDESFDIILAYSSIDHIPEASTAIAEICRVSKKYVAITLPNALDIVNATYSSKDPRKFGYERYWYPRELVSLMLDRDFIPIKYNNNENHIKGNRFGYLFERVPNE